MEWGRGMIAQLEDFERRFEADAAATRDMDDRELGMMVKRPSKDDDVKLQLPSRMQSLLFAHRRGQPVNLWRYVTVPKAANEAATAPPGAAAAAAADGAAQAGKRRKGKKK